MEVLASRVLLHPRDHAASRRFYEGTLGLGVFREFGTPEHPGVVFFLGGGLLELSGHHPDGPTSATRLLLQVRDVAGEHDRLTALGVPSLDPPGTKPWGLVEATLADPDGLQLVLVQVPQDHPQRRTSGPPPAADAPPGA